MIPNLPCRSPLWWVALLVCSLAGLHADEQTAHVYQKEVRQEQKLEYWLSLPDGYGADTSREWPMILFLHGAGERGTDLKQVLRHGPPKLVAQGKKLPFVIVSPQCPAGVSWDDRALMGLLDEILDTHRVDPKRVYLTGLSMGGYGSWTLAFKHPGKFAAVAPICGGGATIDIKLARRMEGNPLKSLPFWVFHGEKDTTVPPEESERLIRELKNIGNTNVRFTFYPEAGHDSWTASYDNPELYDWFFKHHR